MVKGAGCGEADHRGFGGNVGVGVRNAVQARDGTQVHNRAAALFLHLRDFVLHAVIHAQGVDFQNFLKNSLSDCGSSPISSDTPALFTA